MVKKSGPISALIHTTCTHFQKICSCLRHEHCKINIKIQISLVTLLRPCFRIIASKMLIFEVCLLLKTLLTTKLAERPKIIKNTNYFGCTPSFCFRIITSKMLIFQICLPLKEPLVVTFGETRAQTSRKCVAVQGINLTKSSKKQKWLWLHSPIFDLE